MKLIEGHYRPVIDPRYEMLTQANKGRSVKSIDNRQHIVEEIGVHEKLLGGHITEAEAAESLATLLGDKFAQGESIIINNGASGTVIGVFPHFEGAAVVTLQRFGSQKDESVIVPGPHFSVQFGKINGRRECTIYLSEKEQPKEEGLKLHSFGHIAPRPFMVTVRDEILLARADIMGSLTCASEWRGETSWYMTQTDQLAR